MKPHNILCLFFMVLLSFGLSGQNISGPSYKNAKSSEKYKQSTSIVTVKKGYQSENFAVKAQKGSPKTHLSEAILAESLYLLPYRWVGFQTFNGINSAGYMGPKYKNFKIHKRRKFNLTSLRNNMRVF